MSNQLYPSARERFLTKQFDWNNDAISIVLLPSTYIYDENDILLTDITGTVTPVATSAALINKAATGGYAISNPTTFVGLTAMDTVASLVFVLNDGMSDYLVAFCDDVSGFSFAPQGNDYRMAPGGPGGAWFRL